MGFESIFSEFSEMVEPIFALLIPVLLGSTAAIGFKSITQFLFLVINGVAMIFVSKKLNVKNGWFAFIPPFLSPYLYGRLAEESDKIRKPHKNAKRWGSIMLKLHFPAIIAAIVSLIVAIVLFILTRVGVLDMTIASIVVGALVAVTAFLAAAQSITLTILGYVSRYKIYSCFGKLHSIWMILTDLFIGQLAQLIIAILIGFTPIFKGHLRNK